MNDNRGRVRDDGEATLQSRFCSEKIGGVRNPYFDEKPYLLDLKSVCRQAAVRELIAAVNTNMKKKAKNPGHKFKIRYKRKKVAQTIPIRDDCVHRLENGQVRLFGEGVFSDWETGADNRDVQLDFECKLVRDDLGRFWIHAPVFREERPVPKQRTFCGIDPGVRTFLTVYDPNGRMEKLGVGSATQYFEKLYKLDKKLRIKSHYNKKKRNATKKEREKGINPPRIGSHQKRRRLDREIIALRLKLKNMTADLHWKCADLLTKRYDSIAIGKFDTQRMSVKDGRKLKTKTVRNMSTLSHFTFRQRLAHKASLRGSTVYVVSESYTSMTCTCCGSRNRNLGTAEVFRCSSCGMSYDRDGGAARNIFMKTFKAL
jgi:IS605 OrfB family transposase